MLLCPIARIAAVTYSPSDPVGVKVQELMKGYDADMPPTNMNNPNPLVVQFGYAMKSISYDLISGHLILEYWMRLRWLDERLSYNAVDMFGPNSEGNPYLPVKLYSGDNPNIWYPDVVAWEAIDSEPGLVHKGAEVYPREKDPLWNVLLIRPGQMRVKCSPNNKAVGDVSPLERFPFELIGCPITFAPWAYTSEFLELQAPPALSQSLMQTPDSNEYTWENNLTTLKISTPTYSSNGKTYSELEIIVYMRRLPMYFLINAILPMLMMVILSSIAFWIPVNPEFAGAGERMSFAITCMLTIVAVDLFTADKRPMLAETTWLDRWISACMFFTLIPILETAAVFFLQAIFERMQSSYAKALQPPQHAPRTNIKAEKFKTYAKLADDADLLEARRSKRVMAMIMYARENWPCGMCFPRGIDKWARNIYPLVAVVCLGRLFGEVTNELWLPDRRGNYTLSSPAFLWLFIPLVCIVVPVMFFGALVWLVWELWCANQTGFREGYDDPDDYLDSSDDEGSEGVWK